MHPVYRYLWWNSRGRDRARWRCTEVQTMIIEAALSRGDTKQADRFLRDWGVWTP